MSKLVTIRTFTYPHEAAIIRSRLESEGIVCFLRDELTIQVHNFYSNAIGGIKLEVLATDAERALVILEEAERKNHLYVARDDTPVQLELKCASCEGENIHPDGWGSRLLHWFRELSGVTFSAGSSRYKCSDCGAIFPGEPHRSSEDL